jgi:hypothetical protein
LGFSWDFDVRLSRRNSEFAAGTKAFGVEEMSSGFEMVALWNRLAAALAAIASLLQALNIKPGSPP